MPLTHFSHPINFFNEVSGLIHGYLFLPKQSPIRLSAEQLVAYYQGKRCEDGFIWLHTNLHHAAAGRWLRQYFLPDDYFLDEIAATSPRTRLSLQGNALFAVLNEVTTTEAVSRNTTLWAWCCSDMIITARFTPIKMVEELVAGLTPLALSQPEHLLLWLLSNQEDNVEMIIRDTSRQVLDIEERLFDRSLRHNRTVLSKIRRKLLRIQSLLVPEPAALFRLLNRPPQWLAPESVRELREFTEEFILGLNDMGNLLERIRLLQEEASMQAVEENNRTLYWLTVVTVMALPINIIAGLFGMNVGGLPFSNDPHGFWHLLACVIFFTLLLIVLIYRRTR
ncbi:magnesium transporter CorA [Rosenbergiella australiborealis]|uniref:Magnesium transporter CorA n=1 Tax=Rosenbergiella australiborealis TaxID=1544696 RepID=A0ABS5T637_9GAMM|nr:magnesium transporter CorA [Rosenbergiella australiborealis]